MKWKFIELNIKKKEIEHNFNIFVSSHASYVNIGEIYGTFQNNKIKLYKKKAPRSIRILCDYYIYGELDNFGTLRYKYKRTVESVIFTIFAPIFMFVGGVLLGGIALGIDAMFIWIIPAIILLFCNVFKNKNLRKELLSVLLNIVQGKDLF